MKPKILLFLKSFLTCLLSSELVFLLLIFAQNKFGITDIFSFTFWSIPYSFFIGIASILLTLITSKIRTYLQYVICGISGILAGIIWTFLVAGVLGPWFGGFSVPVIVCWIAGGLTSMVFIAGNAGSAKLQYYSVKILIVLVLCLVSAYGFKPFLTYVTHDRIVTLVAVKGYTSDKYSLDDPINGLTTHQKDLIKELGVNGNMKVDFKTTAGNGDPTGLVIILKFPLRKPVKLFQPDSGDLVYIQVRDTAFRYLPSDAKLSDRTIELYPDPAESLTVNYWLDLVGGSRQGGTFLDWKYEH